jgi:hypothetical protein
VISAVKIQTAENAEVIAKNAEVEIMNESGNGIYIQQTNLEVYFY